MKITFSYNYNTDKTTMKPDKVYIEEFNESCRIHKLDFLQDALALLTDEYNKQLPLLWEKCKKEE